ncbi:6-bladed beta-propeller [Parabacteroides sp. OttesenSCG-928-G07]|nr:6-bladed beta-propeller [Parabacteroides sp. OttesenSCG-928-G07]
MNKHFVFIYVVFLLINSIACQRQQGETQNYFYIELTRKTVPKIDELFEDVKYIALQTSDSSLLDEVIDSKVGYFDGRFYIADYKKEITVFDENGKWLHTINHFGESPQDYLGIVTFAIAPNGDLLVVDRLLRGLLFYSANDEFLYAYHNDTISLEDAFFMDNDHVLIRGTNGYTKDKFYLFNRNSREILSSYWSVPLKRKFRYSPSGFFVTYKEKLLYHEMQNTRIYELTPDSAILRYTIDVEGRTPPDGFWERTDLSSMDLNDERVRRGYVDNIRFFSEGNENILLQVSGGGSSQEIHVLIEKATGRQICFDKIAFDDYFTWMPNRMCALPDGQVAILIPPEDILAEKDSPLRMQFPDLKEDDNPILCIAKIR